METLPEKDQVQIIDSNNVFIGNHLTANGDIVFENRRVTNIFYDRRYSELNEKIEQLEQTLAMVPDTKETHAFRMDIARKLSKEKKEKEAYIAQIIDLAETLSKVEVNTKRLKKAKAYFEQGKFAKADKILSKKDLNEEQRKLLAAKARYEKGLAETNELLRKNATEFLIKAKVVSIDYSNPNRLNDGLSYFEASIESFSFYENNFRFANFLQDHNLQLERVESLYLRALEDQATTKESQAAVLKNLGLFYLDKELYKKATEYGEKYMTIQRELAEEQEPKYLRKLADSLDALGCIYKERNNFEAAHHYFEEALEILHAHQFIDQAKAKQTKATVLNNLGALYQEKEDFEQALQYYQSALQAYRELMVQDAEMYHYDYAFIQINLGSVYDELGNIDAALDAYGLALNKLKKLSQKNPYTYSEDLAIVHINMSIFYYLKKPDITYSTNSAKEGMRLIEPLLEDRPSLKEPYAKGEAVLKAWDSSQP